MSSKEKLLASAQKNLEKGQYAKAVKDYEELVALEPKVVAHRQKLADAMVRAQMQGGAVPHYEFVAKSLTDAGFYLKAIAIYKQIQKIEPDRFDIFLRLAELNEKQGLAGNASAEYKSLGALYEKKGMVNEAVNILQKVADMEPGNIQHKVRIAECYTRGGFKEKGREEFERLAAELEAQKSFDQLLKVYEFFVKLFPGTRSAQAGFARTLVLRGDAEKGMQLLKGLIKQSPDDANVLSALAAAYQALGDFENEHLTLQHLLKKHPDDLNTRECLIRSSLAGNDFPRGMDELLKWGGELLQSGRMDAVHAFCRHLQNELPGDDVKLQQVLSALGIASTAPTAPTVASAVSVSPALSHEGDFDLGLELGGISISAPPPVAVEAKEVLPRSGTVVPTSGVAVLSAASVRLPAEVPVEEESSSVVTSSPPLVQGAEESPLDFLEGFGVLSGADVVPVAPPVEAPAPVIAVPAVSAPLAVPELEIDLDLGELELEGAASFPELDVASVDYSDSGAEVAAELIDASTEIAFPDDFTLDLTSSDDVTAVTPEDVPVANEAMDGGEFLIGVPDLDLSLPEDVASDFVIGLDSEAAADEVIAELEPLEELEELEEVEEVEEVELLSPVEGSGEFVDTEMISLDTTSSATDIDFSGFSLDGSEEFVQVSSEDGRPQLMEDGNEGGLEIDLAMVQDHGDELSSSPLPPDVESFSVQGGDASLGTGGEEIAEFDLSAVAVDESMLGLDTETFVSAGTQAKEPSFDELTAELEEVGFYLNQGLYAEAEQVCRRLLEIDPGFVPALDKLVEVESRRRSMAPTVEPDEGDFLDLAAEILDDSALRATENLPGVEDLDRFRFDGVFSEFKKGIESQIDSEDTESHYNLGIAYKEMGLIDDALSEFAKAMSNPARRLDCLTLQGICLAEKGAFAQAEELFASGISNRDLSEMERISLHYEMGLLYESWQRPADALSSFSTVAASDTVFRDVASKIRELQSRLGGSGELPSSDVKPAKNRVSYV